MRKSAAVKLTLVPMLAASVLAYADPPADVPLEPPGMTEEVLMPPGMTPTIDELTCDEDPNWQLRTDCIEGDGGGVAVVRGGYGGFFWTGGG